MRIERLIAITMYLLNRETVSALALAERFEVSKRTIQRDVEEIMKNTAASDKRRSLNVRLLCKREIRQQAIEYLGGEIAEEHDNGDFTMTMNVPFERMWFSLLLGFGDKIEVREPEEIRREVKQIAKEISKIY